MKATLEPISHPELGPIVSEDGCMLPIGRAEEPFASHSADITAKLSRRHARIFQRGNILYLAELGSTNGTQVNGCAIHDKPVRLMPGDEVCFGGEILYRLETDADDTRPMHDVPSPVHLTLTPKIEDPRLAPVVITRFPFVIDKRGSVFSRYKDAFPTDFASLSRRHAVIYLQGKGLHVEDLSSKNGTYVCGEQLDLNTRPLRDGDDICFGRDNIFSYRVSVADATALLCVPAPAPAPVESAEARNEPAVPEDPQTESRTTFVTSGDSFLDIFCPDSEAQADSAGEAVPDDQASSKAPAAREPSGRRPGRIRRFGRVASEFKRALADDRPRSRAPLAVLGAVIAFASVAGVTMHLQGATERKLTELMDRGAYSQAVQEARFYLERHPDNVDVRELATEALLKHLVTPWEDLLAKRNFIDAASLLHDLKRRSQFNEPAAQTLTTLQWIGELQAFMARRESADSFAVFADEDAIANLLEKWDAGSDKHRRSMKLIARYVPTFEVTQSRALSHLRLLRSQASVYAAASATLEDTIAGLLGAGKAPELDAVFDEFERKYPNILGMERLRSDLTQYLAIEEGIRLKKAAELSSLLDGAEFQTPPFGRYASGPLLQSVPSRAVLAGYRDAATAWRAGESAKAQSMLRSLVDAPWGDVARALLARHRSVLDEYEDLRGAQGTARYTERLLSFYASLDPDLDAHYVRSLSAAFKDGSTRARAQAGSAFEDAQALWEQYRAKGGIGGRLRLEAKLSPGFETQAGLLSHASRQVRLGRDLYRSLGTDASPKWRALTDEILSEMERQRRSLDELDMVLGSELVSTKLKLLASTE